YQTVTGLKPNTTYTFRGYVKTGATSTTAYLGVKNHGNAEVSSSTTATGYTLLTATFTTGATNTSAQVYVWTGNTGGVWADDLALVGPTADQVNLAAAFNQVGITTDGTRTTDGGLDGQNNTLSSAALGGASVNWNGVEFALGSTGKNNVVKGGTAVTATLPSGQYSTLNLLATAVGGNRASQTFRVTYSDNTFTDFVRSMSDWFTPQNYAGESVAKASTYRNKGDGTKDSRTFNVYGYTLTLDPAKTVASVTLPASGNVKLLAATLVA
ncbi:MAG TPA: hypothetical protein VK324_03375, partial [Tepidisphaeraceae bacterium]|nr:hypothetical protein [Tepidisphaeraceae bacterium]